MEVSSILEIMMLLCFACSWPFNIRKSYVSRTAKGKSIIFEVIIEFGYACGITAHIVEDDIGLVLAFYFLDVLLVATDMVLVLRNMRLDALAERSA